MKKIASLFTIAILTFSCQNSIPQKESNELSKPNRSLFDSLEIEFLKKDFRGLITSNGKQPNLFPITPTDSTDTQPIKLAAEAFLNALNSDQLDKTCFDIKDDEWQKWCNVSHRDYTRQGICIKEMNGEQKDLAFKLMEMSLSTKGFELSKGIMATDDALRKLNPQDSVDFGKQLYYFTLMGKPSMTEPWGWQIDGHHLVINYFILGHQVVMTPTFMGGEAITKIGDYPNNSIFQNEQNKGLKFMQSLDSLQQDTATLSPLKRKNDIQAEAFADNDKVDHQGLCVANMTSTQKDALRNLIALYVNNMKEGPAKVKMTEIEEHINETYFSWTGLTDENAIFYYRIHSPVLLIEFDHQLPIWSKEPKGRPTRDHIHTIIRTPNGNDYGKDLLRQHLEEYH